MIKNVFGRKQCTCISEKHKEDILECVLATHFETSLPVFTHCETKAMKEAGEHAELLRAAAVSEVSPCQQNKIWNAARWQSKTAREETEPRLHFRSFMVRERESYKQADGCGSIFFWHAAKTKVEANCCRLVKDRTTVSPTISAEQPTWQLQKAFHSFKKTKWPHRWHQAARWFM